MKTVKAKSVKQTTESVLIQNNLVQLPKDNSQLSQDYFATIIGNLAYFGFTLSKEGVTALMMLSDEIASQWWVKVEETLKEITGENRKMSKFVVYKNFPQEVLEMSQVEYWAKQILMYYGLPNKWFVQEERVRVDMNLDIEKMNLKVLHLADENSLRNILIRTASTPNKWTEQQFNTVIFLTIDAAYSDLNTAPEKIVFKENLVQYASFMLEKGINIAMKSATDVLRLAVALSGGDFKTESKFKKFKRKERRYILQLLENTSNLNEDVARRPEKFKKLFKALHPGDYNFVNVQNVYNELYNDNLQTFIADVETLTLQKDIAVLELLQQRPGEFMRRLGNLITLFGINAVRSFASVLPKLSVIQLLKIEKYLKTINVRLYKTVAPKGNWTRLQVLENKTKIDENLKNILLHEIALVLVNKLSKKVAKVQLFEQTKLIKLQTNDSELTNYGRGTVFMIPENVTFIRTASYWQNEGRGANTWFDNGWNFFNANWQNAGSCCWNANRLGDAAIFSGDPTNSKELKGRACQMIDLYIDKLLRKGIRYAVWNILCFSKISFNDTEEVYAALQWGAEAQKGKLFEPSRCQLSFQIKGDNLTKYIAYIDLQERKLVYLDANLKGDVQSADSNGAKLEKVMPAIVEYLESLPSIHDLFNKLTQSADGTKIMYSDKDVSLKEKEEAYVFKTENEENSFSQIDIAKILNS